MNLTVYDPRNLASTYRLTTLNNFFFLNYISFFFCQQKILLKRQHLLKTTSFLPNCTWLLLSSRSLSACRHSHCLFKKTTVFLMNVKAGRTFRRLNRGAKPPTLMKRVKILPYGLPSNHQKGDGCKHMGGFEISKVRRWIWGEPPCSGWLLRAQ